MKKSFIKRLVALALVIVSVFSMASVAFAYTETSVSGTRYITSSNGKPVNVRKGPGTGYELAAVGTFPVGTQVTLLSKATGTSDGKIWYNVVNSSNKGGWVRGDFLTTNSGNTSGQEAWEVRYGTGELSTSGGESTSAQIRNFQDDLEYLGYYLGEGGVDGYYGPDTKAAVIKFQKKYGLEDDGIAGPDTKAKLYSLTLNNH